MEQLWRLNLPGMVGMPWVAGYGAMRLFVESPAWGRRIHLFMWFWTWGKPFWGVRHYYGIFG